MYVWGRSFALWANYILNIIIRFGIGHSQYCGRRSFPRRFKGKKEKKQTYRIIWYIRLGNLMVGGGGWGGGGGGGGGGRRKVAQGSFWMYVCTCTYDM